MSFPLPLKGLSRLNMVLSVLITALITIFLIALDFRPDEVVYRFLQTIVFTNLVGVANLVLFKHYFAAQRVRQGVAKLVFFLASYCCALLAWAIVVDLYSLISGNRWEGEDGTLIPYLLGILAIFSFNTVVLIVQYLFILQYRNSQNEIEKLQLKASASNAMNLLLRQQIQPHFLFNALTTVKALYRQDSKHGEEYLVHLANFLRVSISNPKEYVGSVGQEVAFCLTYLHMQKIRFGGAIAYEIAIAEETKLSRYLPYFAVQTLVENVIKHNDATEDSPVTIRIFEQGDCIVVENNLQERTHKEESSGNELFNIRERYKSLGQDGIRILNEGGFFRVYLTMIGK